VANGLAPGRPNSLGVISSTDGAEKVAKLFTDPWGLGRRSSDQPIDTDRTSLGKVLEPIESVRRWDLDQSIPIPEHLEDGHFRWSKSLVAPPRARSTTHHVD
jgi:hypothetical protein